MKRNIILKFLMLVLIFIPISIGVVGCKGDKNKNNCYYTTDEIPAHIEGFLITTLDGGNSSDNKGSYFEKGTSVRVSFSLELGYNLGTFKILKDETEITIKKDEDGNYYYGEFECSEDFAIHFSGEIKPDEAKVKLVLNNNINPNELESTFIKFSENNIFNINGEMTIGDFKSYLESLNDSQNSFISSCETSFDIYVYTKTYSKVLTSHSTFCAVDENGNLIYDNFDSPVYFYDEENNLYGFKTHFACIKDCTIDIRPIVEDSFGMLFEDIRPSTYGDKVISYNQDLFIISINGDEISTSSYSPTINASYFIESNPTVRISFTKYNDEKYASVYDNLEFTVLNKKINATKSADGSYIEFTLDRIYKYQDNNSYTSFFNFKTNLVDLLVENDLAYKVNTNFSNSNIYLDDQKLEKDVQNSNNIVTLSSYDSALAFSIDNYQNRFYLKDSKIRLFIQLDSSIDTTNIGAISINGSIAELGGTSSDNRISFSKTGTNNFEISVDPTLDLSEIKFSTIS